MLMPLIVKIAYQSKIMFSCLSTKEESSTLENYRQTRTASTTLSGLQKLAL